jgi:hypothetical protein
MPAPYLCLSREFWLEHELECWSAGQTWVCGAVKRMQGLARSAFQHRAVCQRA